MKQNNNNEYNPTLLAEGELGSNFQSQEELVNQAVSGNDMTPVLPQSKTEVQEEENVASDNIITRMQEDALLEKIDQHQTPEEPPVNPNLKALDELEGRVTELANPEQVKDTINMFKDKKILGTIPTDSVKDELLFTLTTLVLKTLRQVELQNDERYGANENFTVAVNSILTEEDKKTIHNHRAMYDAMLELYINNKLDILSKLSAGRSIEKMKFTKHASNEVSYGDQRLGIKSPALGKGGTEDNILAFKAAYRGTAVKIVNLIHSGFTVYLNPPSIQDMILLNRVLHKEEIDLAKDTATLINSSKRCYLLEPLMSFIEKQILKTSLNVPINSGIMRYIDIRDYDILLAGIVSAANGSTIHVNYRCANGYDLKEDNSGPVCNNEWVLKVDMDKMLFIEEDFLPVDYLKQLSKRDVNTVNVEEILEYRRRLDERLDSLREVMIGKLKVVFKIPTIEDYLVTSTTYIEELKDKVAEANVSKNEQERDALLKSMLERSEAMEIFNSIDRLEVVNEDTNATQVLTDSSFIAEIVSDLTLEESRVLYDACYKFMEESVVAKICYPKTYCKECQEQRPETIQELKGTLPTLTPINMLGFFYQAISIQSM